MLRSCIQKGKELQQTHGYLIWRFVVPPGSAELSYLLSMTER
jgi:hypothetical protein